MTSDFEAELLVRRKQVEERIQELQRERDALDVLLGSSTGLSAPSESAPATPVRRGTMLSHAVGYAREHDRLVVLRELLRILQANGFKVDGGGLHTYLAGRADFEHVAPGTFRYLGE